MIGIRSVENANTESDLELSLDTQAIFQKSSAQCLHQKKSEGARET